jgi:hypothetical protein
MLEIRRVDAGAREEIAERRFVVDRGEDRRVGIRPRDLGEDAFAAAALVQVIVNEGDVQDRGAGVGADSRGNTTAAV